MTYQALANVQYRGLKYVYNDFNSSYHTLRDRADLPLLYVHRQRNIMIELYNIINGTGPNYLKQYIRQHRLDGILEKTSRKRVGSIFV